MKQIAFAGSYNDPATEHTYSGWCTALHRSGVDIDDLRTGARALTTARERIAAADLLVADFHPWTRTGEGPDPDAVAWAALARYVCGKPVALVTSKHAALPFDWRDAERAICDRGNMLAIRALATEVHAGRYRTPPHPVPPPDPAAPPEVFLAMPFQGVDGIPGPDLPASAFRFQALRDAVEQAAQAAGERMRLNIRVRLIAERRGGHDIWHSIRDLIARARIVVADFSPDLRSGEVPNPNVVTEAVVARYGANHVDSLLLTTHRPDLMPASWKQVAWTSYEPDRAGLAQLTDQLAATLEDVLGRLDLEIERHRAPSPEPGATRAPDVDRAPEVFSPLPLPLPVPAQVLLKKLAQQFEQDDRAGVRASLAALQRVLPAGHAELAAWEPILEVWAEEEELAEHERLKREAAEQEQLRRERPDIPGFTFVANETFECENDVEGTKRFTVPVYRCDAFAQAIRLGNGQRAIDTEFVLLPPLGYGNAKPGWTGKPFLIARTCVSQRVYDALGGKHDVYRWPGPLQPANQVSWDDAQAWFKQRELAAAGLRLPREAEWEFACRAGTQTKFCFGDGAMVTSEIVNVDGNDPTGGAPKSGHRNCTVDVGSLPGNAFGLHEVHGNLFELCADLYQAGESDRVYRGGCGGRGAAECQSASRRGGTPGRRRDSFGFRPAKSTV